MPVELHEPLAEFSYGDAVTREAEAASTSVGLRSYGAARGSCHYDPARTAYLGVSAAELTARPFALDGHFDDHLAALRRTAEDRERARALRQLGAHALHPVDRELGALEHHRALSDDRQRAPLRVGRGDDEPVPDWTSR